MLVSFSPFNLYLHLITNAPWYVRNLTFHLDLEVQKMSGLASYYYKKCHNNIYNHPNPLTYI